MKILGIDPAPSKQSVVFDGEKFKKYNANELKELITKTKNTLICWDAPLGFDVNTNDFYYRPIELFFKANNKKINDFQIKPPSGISVLPIAGCPHWLISQYIVGYPTIDSKSLKIPLIIKKEDFKLNSTQIVEVHPALAIWIWLKNKNLQKDEWKYKCQKKYIKKKAFNKILSLLKEKNIINLEKLNPQDKKEIINFNDDYLDAYIAWKLGDLLINSSKVMILGEKSGSILLPYDKELKDRFNKFLKAKHAK